MDWIDGQKLVQFILSCQDGEKGGIADHPSNCGDVYHTFFGLCGLSLLQYLPSNRFGVIDPVYALPAVLVKELGMKCTLVAVDDDDEEA